MASTILHGDLAANESPLEEPIYLRPIIRVDPRHSWVANAEEAIPVDRLPVQLVHEAVARMKEGQNTQAPAVRIINLSIGDHAQQFTGSSAPGRDCSTTSPPPTTCCSSLAPATIPSRSCCPTT